QAEKGGGGMNDRRDNATESIEEVLRRGVSPGHAEERAGASGPAAAAGPGAHPRAATGGASVANERAAAAAARRLAERLSAEGLADVSYAPVDSPFGELLAATTRRGLVRLAYPEQDLDCVLETLARRLSPRLVEAPTPLEEVRRELE